MSDTPKITDSSEDRNTPGVQGQAEYYAAVQLVDRLIWAAQNAHLSIHESNRMKLAQVRLEVIQALTVPPPQQVDEDYPDTLALFAIHAPVNIPWRFQPVMPRPRPEAIPGDHDSDGMPLNWQEMAAWDEERKRQTYLQWPWAWAREVMAARKVGAK